MAINWQCFGSNGLEEADYSKGVLERFTRRAPSDWDGGYNIGNTYRKTIDNPRLIRYRISPHLANYFNGQSAINSGGEYIGAWYGNKPILADKIVINHYYIKSREEYNKTKFSRGFACSDKNPYNEGHFRVHDRNEVFDDGILKYRATRAEKFSFESDDSRTTRVVNALFNTLTQSQDDDSLADKLETFLTCRAVAEKFGVKIGEHSAEEYALAWIYWTLLKANPLTYAEIQMFLKALPEILERPFSVCKEIKTLTQENILPQLREALKNGDVLKGAEDWKTRADLLYIQKLLRLIK